MMNAPRFSSGCTRRRFLGLSLMVCAMPACGARKGGSAGYGAKVKFGKGVALSFPDFDLIYTGVRKATSSAYPRGFTYHDFEASRAGTIKRVSWSAGTGDIGPSVFQFRGNEFWLELSRSDKLGKLAENEVVVWKK